MSPRRTRRLQKATALVPLAVLSAAWTVNVTGLGGDAASASSDTLTPAADGASAPAALPDGTPLPPAIGLDHPASLTGPASEKISHQRADQIVASAQSSGIPAAALAAYQRAATVIDAADQSCHLDWQLIGAIGRVESNHGRANGNTLTAQGISTPGIFGPVLDGSGTRRIADTDGGQLDGDTKYDRAVGPMQFIPSTWSMVSVDADGDGQRNPQDINDAALATAVYLCSGDDDLGTTAGQKAAVYRYNHSASYVDTVLAVAQAYLAGDYTSVPNSTLVNDYVFHQATPGKHRAHTSSKTTATHSSSTPKHAKGVTPTKKSTTKTGTSDNTGSGNSGGGKSTPPITTPTQPPAVDKTISQAQALAECEAQVLPATLQTALGGALSGSLSQVVAALDNLPLLGGPAAADKLQNCVADKTKS